MKYFRNSWSPEKLSDLSAVEVYPVIVTIEFGHLKIMLKTAPKCFQSISRKIQGIVAGLMYQKGQKQQRRSHCSQSISLKIQRIVERIKNDADEVFSIHFTKNSENCCGRLNVSKTTPTKCFTSISRKSKVCGRLKMSKTTPTKCFPSFSRKIQGCGRLNVLKTTPKCSPMSQ